MAATDRSPLYDGAPTPQEIVNPLHAMRDVALEAAVLAGAMLDEEVRIEVVTMSEDDFTDGFHQLIFRAIKSLNDRHEPVDPVSTLAELRAGPEKHIKPNAAERLLQIQELGWAADSSIAGIETLRRYTTRRNYVQVLRKQYHAAMNCHPDEIETVVAEGSRASIAIMSEQSKSAKSLGQIFRAVIDDAEKAKAMGCLPPGLATSVVPLDDATGGMKRGQLVVLAGQTSMGKSALGMQIATAAAFAGRRVLAFSFEVPSIDVGRNTLAGLIGTESATIASGSLNEHGWKRLIEAAGQHADADFWCEDRAGLTISHIAARARRHGMTKQLDLVVIDHLNLIAEEPTRENRERQVARMTWGAKNLARDLDCPVMLMAQMNRNIEHRAKEEKEPVLSDLRDSGSIEQDADQVWMLHRPFKDKPGPDSQITRLFVRKNRGGKLCAIELRFVAQNLRFIDPKRIGS